MVAVSISTSTDYSGEQNALIEEQGTSLTVNFELDEAAPEGGLKVFVDSDVEAEQRNQSNNRPPEMVDLAEPGEPSVALNFTTATYASSTSQEVLSGESKRIFFTAGGDNTVTGGEDADQFWIANAEIPESANVITDFTAGEDVLGIAGLGIGFSDVTITAIEGDALISANDSDLAILQGVAADSLTESDFAFV